MTTKTMTQALSEMTSAKPRRRRALHFYSRYEAEVAREMGVQVRMLCGTWGWPRAVDGGQAMSVNDARKNPRNCKRCIRSLSRIARERLIARMREEALK